MADRIVELVRPAVFVLETDRAANGIVKFCCPSITFSQVGEIASSRSAMKTFAPEFRALIIILRSVGPVISTRRSFRSAGAGATCHYEDRISAVSSKNPGSWPLRMRS